MTSPDKLDTLIARLKKLSARLKEQEKELRTTEQQLLKYIEKLGREDVGPDRLYSSISKK